MLFKKVKIVCAIVIVKRVGTRLGLGTGEFIGIFSCVGPKRGGSVTFSNEGEDSFHTSSSEKVVSGYPNTIIEEGEFLNTSSG